jgi:hypothetical protein
MKDMKVFIIILILSLLVGLFIGNKINDTTIEKPNLAWFGNVVSIDITTDTVTDTYIVRNKKIFWKFDYKKKMGEMDDDMTIDMEKYPNSNDPKVCAKFLLKLRNKYKGRLATIVNNSILKTHNDSIADDIVIFEHELYVEYSKK